ncbi:MAG: HAD family hydrolase [Bacteroidetes bacterium]|nr:HAD family hydrolase [Bacteroidota bacterium]MBS1978261.1 HAD family hydrolase [Bacteroidota bacterium]
MDKDHIKVIAFDADDTLWDNEPFFRETENRFCELMSDYLPAHTLERELLQTEITNIELYGYGIKGFILSMIETALRVSDHTIPSSALNKIIALGKEMMQKPVQLLNGAEEVLSELKKNYRLVMATKGDLVDQHRKLHKSGLGRHFHHIEIMTDKKENDYARLIGRLDIQPDEFVMIGNSLKSDILPVLTVGGFGIHVPYHTTWIHERIEGEVKHQNFQRLESLEELIPLFRLKRDTWP